MKIDFKKDFSSFQDGARRMETAMNGTPDRVPVCAQMHEFVMKELGVNAEEFYTTPKLLPGGTLEIMEKYGIDVPFLDYDVYNIEAEALGQAIKYSDIFLTYYTKMIWKIYTGTIYPKKNPIKPKI